MKPRYLVAGCFLLASALVLVGYLGCAFRATWRPCAGISRSRCAHRSTRIPPIRTAANRRLTQSSATSKSGRNRMSDALGSSSLAILGGTTRIGSEEQSVCARREGQSKVSVIPTGPPSSGESPPRNAMRRAWGPRGVSGRAASFNYRRAARGETRSYRGGGAIWGS